MRLIVDKYNLIMRNIQAEEIPLFEIKLNKMDGVSFNFLNLFFLKLLFVLLIIFSAKIVEVGLNKCTWNSVEIPDYIETAHSLICLNIYRNLEITQSNAREIYAIVSNWCDYESDVFKKRDLNKTSSAKELEEKQTLAYIPIFRIFIN